jgi:hypothetical protein
MNIYPRVFSNARPKTSKSWLTILLAVVLLTIVYSCKKSSTDEELILDKNLLKSERKYERMLTARENGPATFEIIDITRNGDMLTIAVKGGCMEHDFQVVWDGEILLSYPAQINLVIHNSSPTTCGTDKEFNVQVDIRKIIEKPDPKGYVFHVANGSVKRDKTLNPDGSVSSK